MPENDPAMAATCWVHLSDEAPTGCWSNHHFGACVLGQANGWLQAELQMSDNLNAVVEIELDRLRSMLIVELRALWHAKFNLTHLRLSALISCGGALPTKFRKIPTVELIQRPRDCSNS